VDRADRHGEVERDAEVERDRDDREDEADSHRHEVEQVARPVAAAGRGRLLVNVILQEVALLERVPQEEVSDMPSASSVRP
jgi:hypothetical protein